MASFQFSKLHSILYSLGSSRLVFTMVLHFHFRFLTSLSQVICSSVLLKSLGLLIDRFCFQARGAQNGFRASPKIL